MKRLAITLACVAAIAGGAFSQDEPLVVRDTVVAVVNRQVITQKDVLDRAAPAITALEKNASLSAAELRERATEIKVSALRAIINEKLMVAEGNRLLASSEAFKKQFDKIVDAHVEEIRRKAGGESFFREELRKKGLTPTAFAQQVREQTLLEYVSFYFVDRDLSVAPREVLEYYRQNLNQFVEPAQVKFRQIFIRVDANRDREAARQRAEEVLSQIKKSDDFVALAQKYSDLNAKDGGLWGPTDQGDFPKAMDDLLFTLPINGIGGPVETTIPGPSMTDSGFMIVKVEERKPARTRAFEEVQGNIEDLLLRRKRISRYDDLIQRLLKENHVEIVK